MSEVILASLRDMVQEDVGGRGLRTDPETNLVTAFPGDLHAACADIADHADASVGIVTGFYIPHAQPPCAETDGPLGALFLARALVPLGVKVVLATDAFCARALEAGLGACGLRKSVRLVTLPSPEAAGSLSLSEYWQHFADRAGPLSHLVALERVGPSHTPDSVGAARDAFLVEVPSEHHDRYHSMRGRDITAFMSPAHRLFELAAQQGVRTIGIGDGGNEIGMGKLPWEVIRRNISGGGLVACRVPVDHLIVCGVSNWGAYALAAGVRLLRGTAVEPELFDAGRERELLEVMVEHGPLVDGVTGEATATVDGLTFEQYAQLLAGIARAVSPH